MDFVRDLTHAFRLIRRSPLFSFYVIAPLALGIGLNGAIFILLDAFLLRPLPVRNPAELVRLVRVIQNIGPRSYFSYAALEALQKKSTSFSDVIGCSDLNSAVRDSSGASRIRCQLVTGNFFTALGVQALYGRVLMPSDAVQIAGAPPVVIGYSYWLREFHGDPGAVGRTITLEEQPVTVVGIMPAHFNGVEAETTPDIRAPLSAAGSFLRDSEGTGRKPDYRNVEYSLVARMRPGVGLAQARAESEGIVNAAQNIQSDRSVRDERFEVQSIVNGVSLIRPKFGTALVLLMSGVGLLLLMICANVGGLLLARASSRRAETAVRLAIGATSARLARQWLTESLVLTGIGLVAGLAIAFAAAPVLVHALPAPRDLAAEALTLSLNLTPDIRVFGFALVMCVACTLFSGIPAALEASRSNLHASLRSTRATSRQPVRWVLVAIQIGLCTFLLAGAGLLISTFKNLRSLDPGFDRDHIVTFSLDPNMAHYTPDQSVPRRKRLLAAAEGLPGVQSAAIADRGVMRGTGIKMTIAAEGEMAPRSDFMNTSLNSVSPEYFETMGIPFLEGRNFRPGEPLSKPELIVVNRAFVRRFAPAGDSIGRRFGSSPAKIASGDFQIIGVVGDAKYRTLREPIPPTIYHGQQRSQTYAESFILHVRTRNRPESIIESVRRALAAIDPRLPFFEVRTLAQEVDSTLWAERLLAWLSAVFAGVAIVLATLGVYATLAYAITQSRREIGIRVALGAQPRDVLRLFSARPMCFAGLGVLLGVAGFYAATPAFRSVLYEVSSTDPISIVSAATGVLLIALAATVVAINGALRVDPAIVLRDE